MSDERASKCARGTSRSVSNPFSAAAATAAAAAAATMAAMIENQSSQCYPYDSFSSSARF